MLLHPVLMHFSSRGVPLYVGSKSNVQSSELFKGTNDASGVLAVSFSAVCLAALDSVFVLRLPALCFTPFNECPVLIFKAFHVFSL